MLDFCTSVAKFTPVSQEIACLHSHKNECIIIKESNLEFSDMEGCKPHIIILRNMHQPHELTKEEFHIDDLLQLPATYNCLITRQRVQPLFCTTLRAAFANFLKPVTLCKPLA